jgi:hypothetical protein
MWMAVLIRTSDVPPAYRYDAWRGIVCDTLGPLNFRSDPDVPLSGEIEAEELKAQPGGGDGLAAAVFPCCSAQANVGGHRNRDRGAIRAITAAAWSASSPPASGTQRPRDPGAGRGDGACSGNLDRYR